jgi:hypothetical protein
VRYPRSWFYGPDPFAIHLRSINATWDALECLTVPAVLCKLLKLRWAGPAVGLCVARTSRGEFLDVRVGGVVEDGGGYWRVFDCARECRWLWDRKFLTARFELSLTATSRCRIDGQLLPKLLPELLPDVCSLALIARIRNSRYSEPGPTLISLRRSLREQNAE